MVAALPKPWTLLKRSTQTVRWNKHALQQTLRDVPRSLPDRTSREDVEQHWQVCVTPSCCPPRLDAHFPEVLQNTPWDV